MDIYIYIPGKTPRVKYKRGSDVTNALASTLSDKTNPPITTIQRYPMMCVNGPVKIAMYKYKKIILK